MKTVVVDEAQARHHESDSIGATCVEVTNCAGDMTFHEDSKEMRLSFEHMKVNGTAIRGRTGNGYVAEKKYALVFKTEVSIAGHKIRVETTSLPIAIVVHKIQEDVADATVMWDNAFAKQVIRLIQRPSH